MKKKNIIHKFAVVMGLIFALNSFSLDILAQKKKPKPKPKPQAVAKDSEGDVAFNEGRELFKQKTLASYQSALTKFNEALGHYQSDADKEGEADTYMVIGRIYFSFRQFQKSMDNFSAALKVYKSLNNYEGITEAHNNIGAAYRETDQYDKAVEWYSAAYSLKKHITKVSPLARICNGYGESLFYLGRIEEAKAKLLEAEKNWLEIPGNEDKVRTNYLLGRLYLYQKESSKGLQYLNKALTESRQFDNPVLEADILESLADYHYNNGEIPKSLQIREQIVDAFQKSKAFNVTQYRRLVSILNLIPTYSAVGDFMTAFANCDVALPIARQEGYLRMVVSLLLSKGELFSDQGKYAEATAHFNEALAITKKENFKDVEPNILESLARVNYETGNLKQAENYLTQMAQILDANPDAFNEPYLYAGLIITYAGLQDTNKVNELIRRAQSKKLDVGKREGNLRLALAIGFAQLMQNQNQAGLQTVKSVYDASARIGHEVEKARAAITLSIAYMRNGDLQNAFQYAQASHDFWKKIGNDFMDMETHIQMGQINFQTGQGQNAVVQFTSALDFAQKLNLPQKQGEILYNLGATYIGMQNSEQAINYLNQSLSIFERLRNSKNQVQILNDLGSAYEMSGNKKKAKEFRDKAKKIKQ